MATDPRTRLEQLVRSEGLSVTEFVDQFHELARKYGEGQTVHTSITTAKRWMAGGSDLPRAVSRRILERWWKEKIEHLFGPPVGPPARVRATLTGEELIVTAGRESVEHAIEAASALDPSALEHLHAAAQHAARDYYVAPPLHQLTNLVRLRDTVYQQLDRTHKPLQQAELYLVAGQICGLLSSVSWDLGHPEVAEEQARAAYTYGQIIDHPSLCAWARALQTTVAFWNGQPRRAAHIAASALDAAPHGTASARLHSVHARSLAMIGARQEVQVALNAASDELDRAGDDPFLDEIGGELGFDRSRHALCAGASFVALNDGERAESEALTALNLFAEMPKHTRWAAGALGAHVDLATARAMRRDVAGAEDALSAVLATEPDRRTEAISRRLTNLGRILGMSQFQGAIEVARLSEAIEDFTAFSLARVTARPAIGG
jgi:hypothetical protein